MVTVTVAPTVSGDGMGTPAVDVVVRAVDAAQAAAGGPCAVGGVGSRAGGAAHGVVGEPPAVPVNVSNTDTPGERGTGDIGVQADGGCEPVAGAAPEPRHALNQEVNEKLPAPTALSGTMPVLTFVVEPA